MAGSPPRPHRRGDRCLPLLRRPDADLRPAAAGCAAAPTDVVRQFMKPSPPLPLRTVASGNTNHGASQRVSCEAMFLASRSAGPADVVTRTINRQPQSQSTRSNLPRRQLWPAEPTVSATDRSRGRHNNPHRRSPQALQSNTFLPHRRGPDHSALTPRLCAAPPSQKRSTFSPSNPWLAPPRGRTVPRVEGEDGG